MKYLLLHSPSWNPAPLASTLQAEHIEVRRLDPANLGVDQRPTALLVDLRDRASLEPALLAALTEAGVPLLLVGNGEEDGEAAANIPEALLSAYVHPNGTQRQLLIALRNALRTSAAQGEAAHLRREMAARTAELAELTDIGIRLTTEKNLNTLLGLILSQARRVTRSDAGSLYLVETDDAATRRLRFKLSQNDSRPDIPFVEATIALDHTSLAGYAALEAEPLVFDDVYLLPPDVAYSFNRSFDQRYGYRTKSMLVIPMQNHHGEVLGVLQLINRKRDPGERLHAPADAERLIIGYSPHTVQLVRALASQAAVSIENSQLYEAIERLFEGFVRAAVHAIEQRDPTTSGHSERVATRTVALAHAVDRAESGPYRHLRFDADQVREIRYAGLLHDFGKVGVREQVLVKAKKLYPSDLTLIRLRQQFIRRTAEWSYEKARAEYLATRGPAGYAAFLAQLERKRDEELRLAERFLRVVLESNEPSVLPSGTFEQLAGFAQRHYADTEGRLQPFLTEPEVRVLSIRRGSLDEAERLEIESHVTHTFGFLRKIPWTRNLNQVAGIAYGHHEKLDGSGYPRQISGSEIPIQTRMMTIADIYDALTAQDRPYKPALPAPRALDILADEVKEGMLDPELFRLFVEARVWEGDGQAAS